MKRKNRKRRRGKRTSEPTRKISEMVWEFAGEFIRGGATLEEKQNRLNAACTAWNIACRPPGMHNPSLDQYAEGYRSYNPDASDEDIAGIRRHMKKLMRNKLRLFPAVQKQIVGAQLTQAEGVDRIEIASARLG